ncbi:MAG TPA: hypothetical protein VGS41_04345, partial [Chthonomonadales bacterium]|nr:hypothetical protein [Chthonomonadales bacterium]
MIQAEIGLITSKPPLTLVTGPAGSGKTRWSIERLLDDRIRVLLIVSSPQQAQTRRLQVADRTATHPDAWKDRVFSFRSLLSRIAEADTDNSVRTIGRTLQRLLIDQVIRHRIVPEHFLGGTSQTPGFAAGFAAALQEWKLSGLAPQQLAEGARPVSDLLADPDCRAKLQELAALYNDYQQTLARHRFADEEDRLALAARYIARGGLLPNAAESIVLDGFYRFNRQQRMFLGAIARRADLSLAITLPADLRRPLLFAAPARTMQRLQDEFEVNEHPRTRRESGRHNPLSLLERGLFAGECAPEVDAAGQAGSTGEAARETPQIPLSVDPPGEVTDTMVLQFEEGDSATASGPAQTFGTLEPGERERQAHRSAAVLQMDCPNQYVECEMVAREFLRIHQAGEAGWGNFAIVLRSATEYAPMLRAVFERYSIPLARSLAEPLRNCAPTRLLDAMLAVLASDWRREEVLTFSRAGYLGIDRLAADELRRRARAARVRTGSAAWLSLARRTGGEQWQRLCDALCTLEELSQRLSVAAEASSVADELTSAITALARKNGADDAGVNEPDRAALEQLRSVMQAVAEMYRLTGQSTVSLQEFGAAVIDAASQESVSMPAEHDRVQMVEPYDAHAGMFRVAAVMGLTERIFPRRIAEDPFLRDDERSALGAICGSAL